MPQKARPRIFPLPHHPRLAARWDRPVRVMSIRLWARHRAMSALPKPVGQMDSPDRFFVHETER